MDTVVDSFLSHVMTFVESSRRKSSDRDGNDPSDGKWSNFTRSNQSRVHPSAFLSHPVEATLHELYQCHVSMEEEMDYLRSVIFVLEKSVHDLKSRCFVLSFSLLSSLLVM